MQRYTRYKIQLINDNITSWCMGCSFQIVATRLAYYSNKYLGRQFRVNYFPSFRTAIYIGDLLNVAEDKLKIPALYWLDTPFVKGDKIEKGTLPPRLIVTSRWNYLVAKSLSTDPEIIPRAVHDEIADKIFQENPEKKFDVVALVTGGTNTEYKEHKLLYNVLKDLDLIHKSFLICNDPWCHRRLFTVNDEEVYRIMAQGRVFISLTDSEGFSLPPAEAMSVGTPVIHFDSPFVSAPYEYYDGTKPSEDDVLKLKPKYNRILHFPVPVYDYKLTEANHRHGRYYYKPVYDYKEVLKTVKEALYITSEKDGESRLLLHDHVQKYMYHSQIIKKIIPA